MTEVKKKRRESNSWLIDQEFLLNSDFFDLYYMQTLTRTVWNYLINLPIPVLSTWDKTNKRIYFSIGIHKRYFPVDPEVAYDDFITLVDLWTCQFFPHYEIEYDKEVDYTDEEIIVMVEEENINLNDALLRKKVIKYKEIGTINKIFMGTNNVNSDQFILNIDGDEFYRRSGTIKDPKPIKLFIKELRKIKESDKIKEYIFDNSTEISQVEKDIEIISLVYSGKTLFNFVKINLPLLKNYKFKRINPRTWKWGKYIMQTDSDILESDILKFLRENDFTDIEM